MNSKKVFFIMITAVSLVGLLTGGLVFLGNSRLQASADQLVELKLENRVLEEQQLSLNKAKQDIAANQELEKIAKVIVPQEKDQARTVRELINLANAAGIKIASISFPSSNLGQAKPAAIATPEATTPAPTAPAAPPITQVQPVAGINGVYQLEVNVQSDGNTPVSYEKFISFLDRLEQNRRTAQVTSINVTPSQKEPGSVTFNLIVNVFIKP